MSSSSFVSRYGGMRLAFVGVAVAFMMASFFSGDGQEFKGVMLSYVIPALVVVFFFVFMLDVMMNRIFMIEQSDEKQAIHRSRIRLNLAAVVGLMLFWGPYFLGLLNII